MGLNLNPKLTYTIGQLQGTRKKIKWHTIDKDLTTDFGNHDYKKMAIDGVQQSYINQSQSTREKNIGIPSIRI